MKSAKLFLVCMVILLCVQNNTSAQLSSEVRIASVDIKYTDDKVQVPYKIINGKASDRYVVWIEFFNEKHQSIAAKSVKGDIYMVEGIGDKMITWDAKADGYVFNEKLSAKVSAKLVPKASTGKALFYSTLFPGAGDYQYKKGKPYWLKGIIGYGLLGGSLKLYSMSTNEYDKYRLSNLPSIKDPNFKNAEEYRQISLAMASAGAAVWFFNYVGILSKSSKYKKINTQSVITDTGYRFYSAISPSKVINTRSLPPNLFADLEFIDDNHNGILEDRENAKLKITLSNQGGGDAMLMEVNVTSDMVDNSMKIYNANQKINVLRPNEKIEIEIPITTDINLRTATHRFTISVSEYYGYDMEPAYLVLNTYSYQPPKFAISGYEIIDSGLETMAIKPDGQLQAGEQVKVKLVIQNIGQGVAKNATYIISTTDPNIFIDNISGKLDDVQPGEVKEIYFILSPNRRVKAINNLPIYLTINEEIGRGSLINNQLQIALDQTPPKANIVEIKSDVESLTKKVAHFEYTSNKFRTHVANFVNIKNVAPSLIKRPNSVGVVIGVKQYRELPPAPYADNDAQIMKNYFEKVLGVEQVIEYTNEAVTGFVFDDIFNPDFGELSKAIVKNESEVFVYYSGHGVPDKDGNNIFLFPSDGKISRLEIQGYNVEKLYENLSKLGAKHVTVILDACFSGSSRNSVKVTAENLTGQKGIKIQPKNSWFTDPNFTVITSSTAEETSLGFDDAETGLFTYYLAAGLQGAADTNGDRVINLGELREYVTSNVQEASKKMLGQQTPVFHGDDSIVITTY
jgi:hypothetical protein